MSTEEGGGEGEEKEGEEEEEEGKEGKKEEEGQEEGLGSVVPSAGAYQHAGSPRLIPSLGLSVMAIKYATRLATEPFSLRNYQGTNCCRLRVSKKER